MTAASIVERLVALREESGLTQADVASLMGTSQPVVARLETGGRDPRLSTLERYARTVGAQVEVRRSKKGDGRTAARLAERIRDRLEGRVEVPTTTFREVIQFLDDTRALTDDELGAAVRPEPLSTGDRRWDAMIAAAVDWVTSARNIDPPRWTGSSRRRLARPGWVLTPHRRLHGVVRESTPVEFSRHGVYVDSSSLMSV